VNSDNYYPEPALTALRVLGRPGLVAFRPEGLLKGGNISPDRLNRYAAAIVGQDDYLERIVEKPNAIPLTLPGPTTFISMNCWRFSRSIFAACRAISPSARHEFELADAVEYAMSQLHARFRAVKSDGAVLDLSDRSDIPRVARMLQGVTART
jgi:dTDP-glucose pyrophosphorylase